MPGRLVAHDGPSTLTVSLLRKDGKTYAHILSYIPVRKSEMIDIIEERTRVRDVTFRFNLPGGLSAARVVPDGVELEPRDGCVKVP